MHVVIAGPASPQRLSDLLDVVPSRLPRGLGGTPVNLLVRAMLQRGHRVSLVTVSPEIQRPQRVSGVRLQILTVPWRARARDRARDGFRREIRYLEAGIDTVFLSFQSSEPDPARHREVVRAAMRALAPAAG